jgi:hypothetical protein
MRGDRDLVPVLGASKLFAIDRLNPQLCSQWSNGQILLAMHFLTLFRLQLTFGCA